MSVSKQKSEKCGWSDFELSKMAIFNLYIFDRNGACVFYREWKREKLSGLPTEEEYKLMFGMLHSLKSFSTKLAPRDGKQAFRSFQTSAYKLTFYETATAVKFVINTDVHAADVQELLRQIYAQVYVETVVKNPVSPIVVGNSSCAISSELFKSRVDELVQKHSSFS